MATPVIMPRQGQSVESCIIGEWHRQVGEAVAAGDKLFTYETDKAVFDEPSPVAGVLLARFFEVGEDVPVLTTVCVIGEAGEDSSALKPAYINSETQTRTPTQERTSPERPKPGLAATPEVSMAASRETPGPQTANASPRARALAARWGLESVPGVPGSGPDGRVLADDIRAARMAGAIPTPAASLLLAQGGRSRAPGTGIGGVIRAEDVKRADPEDSDTTHSDGSVPHPYTRMRQIIASTMTQSLAQMAQLTLQSSFDAGALMALRAQLQAADGGTGQQDDAKWIPSINDLILFAVTRVLMRHPLLNAHSADDHIRLFEAVHLGVAVDTPRGLMVPTLFDAQRMDCRQISQRVRELAALCRLGGAIAPDLLQGGTFTVSNLGAMGIESFTPIINPPQTAILGVCALETRLHPAVGSGSLATYPAIPLVLTFDHRVMDGADAARFLQDLCGRLSAIDETYI